MSQPTIEQARAFCEVADLGSYEKAGERLGQSRLSVIRLVQRFAESLERAALFTPSQQGKVSLSAAGREVLRPAQRFLAAAEDLTETRTEIRFSAYPSIVEQIMDNTPELLEDDPPLRLEDVSEERRGDAGVGLVQAVAAGRLDLAAAPSGLLKKGELRANGLRELPLYKWKLRVVLPHSYPNRKTMKRISPTELDELQISAAPHGHFSRRLLDAAFTTAGVELNVALESSSQHMLRSVAERSTSHAAVLPEDAFGGLDETLGPALTDGGRKTMGGAYSLYLRDTDPSGDSETARRELRVEEKALGIQSRWDVPPPA